MDWTIHFAGLTLPVAFSSVAFLGYLAGLAHRNKTAGSQDQMAAVQRKVERADELIRRIESVSKQLRRHLAAHHANVHHCREKLQHLKQGELSTGDQQMAIAVSDILTPAEQLTHEIATAYDELRKHSRDLAKLRYWS